MKETILTPADIHAQPRSIAATIRLPSGAAATFRPMEAGDAALLGAYFLGLSRATKGFFGPHPFDQATADKLAAPIDYAKSIRMIATIDAHGQEQHRILLHARRGRSEQERFERWACPWTRGWTARCLPGGRLPGPGLAACCNAFELCCGGWVSGAWC
jgi:hypothetical protein